MTKFRRLLLMTSLFVTSFVQVFNYSIQLKKLGQKGFFQKKGVKIGDFLLYIFLKSLERPLVPKKQKKIDFCFEKKAFLAIGAFFNLKKIGIFSL